MAFRHIQMSESMMFADNEKVNLATFTLCRKVRHWWPSECNVAAGPINWPTF